MQSRKYVFITAMTVAGALLVANVPAWSPAKAQQSTGSIPTVTGTPAGPMVSLDPSLDQVDVYSGPSTFLYPPVGVLLVGDRVPVLGRSRENGDWLQIRYVGVPDSIAWVYGPYVRLTGAGAGLPLIDSPPTPTPFSTPTIDPTLAAAFIAPQTATRLPTFTAPAPLAVPTFVDDTQGVNRIPIGMLIFGFLFVGVLGAVISFLRGR